MKDPLSQLWKLYEDMQGQPKPDLFDDNAELETPDNSDNYNEHPVISQRNQVDDLRLSGIPADRAHETVHGEVDLSDTDQKGKLAATLSRVQKDNGKKGVSVDTSTESPSLLALDTELDKNDKTTTNDLKTAKDQEIPDALEPPVKEQLTLDEEIQYTDDISYLKKYGRA